MNIVRTCGPKRRHFWILGFFVVASAMYVTPALSQCPGSGPPHIQDEVNHNAQFLQVCRTISGSPGCDTPQPPIATNAGTLSQAMSLQATVPPGPNATSVWWRADSFDPNTGPTELWEQASSDGMPPGGWTPGSMVTFGAPGLREHLAHEFRVAFCSSSGCTCWSQYSSQYSTTDFSGAAPVAPTNTIWQVEDTFNRRPTSSKYQGGDGLGPNLVWMENTLAPVTNIASDGQTALVLDNGDTIYLARQATHEHSFAEVLFKKNDLTQSGYNFELNGRIHMALGGGIESYQAKLIHVWRGCSGPAVLLVLRADENMKQGTCDNGTPTFPSADWIYLPASPPVGKCDQAPPLDSGDSVWLRIEMQDNLQGDPQVTATAAWGNCPAGGNITDCQHVCTLTRTDTGDPKQMVGLLGEWGFTGHEPGHRIDIFRAGSQPVP